MIINKSKPVSLSMRMRTDAAKLPPERHSARGGSNDMSQSWGGTSSLPEINANMSGMPTSNSNLGASHNLSLGMNYALTTKRKDKDLGRQDIEVERQSGIKDYMESGAVFADRTKMTMPTASCVRCGEHASTCMSCTEYLAEEALNFYRKTRARGAASLFANAITQTGITTVVKYIVYSLWKNSFRIRKWAAKKKAFKAEIVGRVHYMAPAFKAWAGFRTQNKVDRRDKEIEALAKRVAALEAATNQASNLQKNAEKALGKVQREKDGFLKTIDEHAARIEGLEALLLQERQRVVGLSSLTLPVLKYDSLATSLIDTCSKDIHRKLFIAAASQQPAYEYGKAFNNEDLDLLIEDENKRRRKNKRFKAEDLDEDVEMVEMLLQWASAKSRDAGGNIDNESGKALDSFLPKYKKVGTFDDFKNGSALMRIVVGLLWDTPQPGHTTLKLASAKLVPAGMTVETVDSKPKGAGVEKEADEHAMDQAAVIAEVKAAMKTPFEMVTCAASLAHRYLALPSFQVGDLIACRPDIYAAALGYLMLASAAPAQSTGNLAKVSGMINLFEKASGNADYARRQIELKSVTNIKRAWSVLHGLETETEEAGGAASPAPEVETSASDEAEEESKGEGRDGDAAATEGVEVVAASADVEPEAEAAAPAEPVEEQTSALSKYSSLAVAVDGYISLLGEIDPNTFSYEKAAGPIPGQIHDYAELIGEMDAVKVEVDEHLVRADQGYRLANKARMTMSRFQMELMCSELSWLE